MTLSKKQAADALHISLRTLERRMASGQYKYTREGDGQFAEVSFTYADLGLTEPAPEPAPQPYNNFGKEYDEPTAQPTSAATQPAPKHRPPSDYEKKIAADLIFAGQYLAGEVADSCGNKVDMVHSSALGPVEVQESAPADTQSHMNPVNLADRDTVSGEPIAAPAWDTQAKWAAEHGYTRSGNPLCEGITREQYDMMMNTWKRSGGGRSECEMEAAVRRSRQAIGNSFPNSPHTSRSVIRRDSNLSVGQQGK